MKRILITGVNSYVGNSFAEWMKQYPENYEIDKISLRDGSWRDMDFSNYDSILHVAGIAHVSKNPKMKEEYYRVNRDLTIEVADKAKQENVQQFIFMSSIIVYGDSKAEKVVIDEHTKPKPSNFYGQSKLEAEKGIQGLESESFKIVIIRPPMIYGKDSKGNYHKLSKAAQLLPVFPDIRNVRSMIHIDNLSEFLRLMIQNEEKGLFFPQNEKFVRTSDMVKRIANTHDKSIKLTRTFNPILKLLINKVDIVNKVFGNLVYDQKMSRYTEDYNTNDFIESINVTER